MATAIDRIDSLNVFDKAIDDDDEGAEGDNVDDEVDASVPTSSLYASTMAALAGYDDPSGSVAVEAPYYIGREVDVLRAPIVTLRSVPDSPSIYAFTSRGAVRSWNDAGVIEHDAQLGACPTSSADLLNDDDLFVTGDATGSVAVWNEFGNQTASMTLTSTPVKLSRVVCRSAAGTWRPGSSDADPRRRVLCSVYQRVRRVRARAGPRQAGRPARVLGVCVPDRAPAGGRRDGALRLDRRLGRAPAPDRPSTGRLRDGAAHR